MTSEPYTLRGRRILVAGATGDLGQACSQAAAQLGADLHVTGRSEPGLVGLKRTCAAGAGQVACHRVDLTDAAEVGALAVELPSLDGLVYAAGVATLKPLSLLTKEEVGAVMRLNFEAAGGLTQALLKHRRLQDGASLVYLASIAGRRGAAAYSAYSASKGALVAWARSLSMELAARRIRVNTVSPGLVASAMAEALGRRMSSTAFAEYTRRYPLGLGRPEDVAWAVCYLLAPASSWVTGTDLVVDGGVSAT